MKTQKIKIKICSKGENCVHNDGPELPLSEFYKNSRSKNGLRYDCKSCCIKRVKCYEIKHKEKRKKYNEQYRLDNNEYLTNQKRIYYKKNRETILGRNKQYRKTHKREKLNYHNKLYNSDMNYKLLCLLRHRIRGAITKQYGNKKFKSIELLGCTVEEARIHLESQFQEDMSWDNHGLFGWHIDHIRPCASFDLTDPEQQKECFNYKNLQPLWAFDNLSKGDKWKQR